MAESTNEPIGEFSGLINLEKNVQPIGESNGLQKTKCEYQKEPC